MSSGPGATLSFLFAMSFCASGPVPPGSAAGPAPAQQIPEDFSDTMMESTYLIIGPAQGNATFGAGFVLSKELRENPQRGRKVLVTAAHVLQQIQGDQAILGLRARDSVGGFVKNAWVISIRKNGKALWTQHASADVAAMLVSLPDSAAPGGRGYLPTSVLAVGVKFDDLALHSGDQVFALGFPSGVANGAELFPVLRAGWIAQYPIRKTAPTVLIDFPVFGGNSGGPVYISTPIKLAHGGVNVNGYEAILGLVSSQWNHQEDGGSPTSLELANVVTAQAIRETLDAIPEASSIR